MKVKELDSDTFSKLYDEMDEFNQELATILAMNNIDYEIADKKVVILSPISSYDLAHCKHLARLRMGK